MKPLKIRMMILLATMLCVLCAGQASALEYTIDAPEDYLFGRPTSDDTIYEREETNVDRSKNAALIPPTFGSPTSYLPGSGDHLTPNLAPGNQGSHGNPAQRLSWEKEEQGSAWSSHLQVGTEWSGLCDDAGGLVNQVGSVNYPTVDVSGGSFAPSTSITGGYSAAAFTEVTDDLYYSGGHLGTLKIPSLGLTVKVYEGTDSAALAKGAGHFEDTSIWAGNVCIAGHNRGVNNHFGQIHTLEAGDEITLTTKLGTRTYAVTSVEKILETDTSDTTATSDNRITLFTCVRDQREYRWCVTAVEKAA